MKIDLPNEWKPREYQKPLWRYLWRGGKRAVSVWHRRAGKDNLALNWTAVAAHMKRGNYLHCLPEYEQGRKAIWTAVDSDGRRLIDQAFPPELRAATDSSRMQIHLGNGSTWQVGGSDRYNTLVGTNYQGIVFSEYALSDPLAWQYLRPVLRNNNGWAIFIYTPRGHGHGKELYDLACSLQDDPEEPWFAELLTVEDTGYEYLVAAERKAGMPESYIQQEYYGSWIAPNAGAVFGEEMMRARKEGRVTAVPVDSGLPVDTFWDLGVGDSTAIWFTQTVGRAVHCIDYYETSNAGFGHYAKVLRDRGYLYGEHFGPHDLEKREMGSAVTAKTLREHAADAGITFKVVPRVHAKADSIEAARRMLSSCYIDAERCKRGVNCLEAYGYAWDDRNRIYRSTPAHNWASHGADAFQTLALGHRFSVPGKGLKIASSSYGQTQKRRFRA